MAEFDLDVHVEPRSTGVTPHLASGFVCPPTNSMVCLSPWCLPTVGCPISE